MYKQTKKGYALTSFDFIKHYKESECCFNADVLYLHEMLLALAPWMFVYPQSSLM